MAGAQRVRTAAGTGKEVAYRLPEETTQIILVSFFIDNHWGPSCFLYKDLAKCKRLTGIADIGVILSSLILVPLRKSKNTFESEKSLP